MPVGDVVEVGVWGVLVLVGRRLAVGEIPSAYLQELRTGRSNLLASVFRKLLREIMGFPPPLAPTFLLYRFLGGCCCHKVVTSTLRLSLRGGVSRRGNLTHCEGDCFVGHHLRRTAAAVQVSPPRNDIARATLFLNHLLQQGYGGIHGAGTVGEGVLLLAGEFGHGQAQVG